MIYQIRGKLDETIDGVTEPIKIEIDPGWNVPEKYEKKVKKYLEKYQKKVAKQEFKAVKESLIASLTKFNLDTASISWNLGYFYLFGNDGSKFLSHFENKIDGISRDDVSKTAVKYFKKDRRYEIIYEPE